MTSHEMAPRETEGPRANASAAAPLVRRARSLVRREGLARAAFRAVSWPVRRYLVRRRSVRVRDHVSRHNDFFFEEVGVAKARALDRCAAIMAAIDTVPEDQDLDSTHFAALAAVSLSGFSPRNILEIGTHFGFTTVFLGECFPNANIYTVELPESDPIYRRFHGGHERRHGEVLRARLSGGGGGGGVRLLRLNSVDLRFEELPEFDLIWLDGGHNFPEVAWDHFLCMNRLAPGGWLFSDDVVLPDHPRAARDRGLLDVHHVIRYYNDRLTAGFRLLLKREDPTRYVVNPKYVAVFRRAQD